MQPKLIHLGKDIKNFFKQEAAAGILLCITAIIAMIVANSSYEGLYNTLLQVPVSVTISDFKIAKPLLLWVNDGLMAFFFFLVGLELKREFIEGELSSVRRVMLPAIGAIGGIIVPALIYVALNHHDPVAVHGWAIPAATDIAFALGILALLGKRVPISLKILLTSIAIFDDIGAIIIIALFYTSKLYLSALGIALACCCVLFILNRMGVTAKSLYIMMGIIMWAALLKSGVHATLGGIMLAFFIPMKDAKRPDRSPLKTMEHDLHYVVAFFVLPVFAFFNAGVHLSGFGLEQFTHSVPLGIALGLFFGKQIGIFTACWLGIKMKFAQMPDGASWLHLYGVSLLCGVGFTMSLFIGGLAFEEIGSAKIFDERIGIITGSLVSGLAGYLVLRYACKGKEAETQELQSQQS